MKYNTEALKNFIVTEGGFIFNPTTGEILSTNEVGITIVNCLKVTSRTISWRYMMPKSR